jgi:hypothetical protein
MNRNYKTALNCLTNNSLAVRFIFSIIFLSLTCCNFKAKETAGDEKIIYKDEDVRILEQIFELFANDTKLTTSILMVKLGTYFQGTPYVGHTLEAEGEEQLVINLREMDCTTLVENCLALAKTIQNGEPDFSRFASRLKNIRYRSGIINGYPSRLHYTTDWFFDNQQKKLVRNLSKEIGGKPCSGEINFMSTHIESYRQLKENPEWVEMIIQQEKEINSRRCYFLPKEKLYEAEDQLNDGDIVGITTSIKGLDVSHMGILVRKSGRIHLLHASSSAGKVLLSEETLEEYLMNSKSATGIIIARVL